MKEGKCDLCQGREGEFFKYKTHSMHAVLCRECMKEVSKEPDVLTGYQVRYRTPKGTIQTFVMKHKSHRNDVHCTLIFAHWLLKMGVQHTVVEKINNPRNSMRVVLGANP